MEALLDGVFSRRPGREQVLGQFFADGQEPWQGVKALAEHPFLAIQKRWVLANSGLIDFTSIDEYIARGGYSAVQRALTTMTRQEVVDEILASGLRGRGGGGFPTGKKWQMALTAAGRAEVHRSATPTRATRARSWTAPCARATRTGCWRA